MENSFHQARYHTSREDFSGKVADCEDAKAFFSEVLGMINVRDDRHQTIFTMGNVALFRFGTEKAPPSDELPSRWYHIGFVVDNLDAA